MVALTYNGKMKIVLKYLTLLLASLSLFFCQCSKDTPLTEKEKVTAIMTSAGAWVDPVVTVDGIDHSDVYRDFRISFAATTYSSTGGAPVWSSSGTWVFVDDNATRIKMDGSRDVEISASGEFLELTFQWDEDTFEPGRKSSIKGKQKFKLKKNP